VKVWAARLAALATGAAAFFVLLVYVPALAASFLVPKFTVLGLCASAGLAAFGLRRAAEGRRLWTRPIAAGALLVLATTAVAWARAAGDPVGAPYAAEALWRWGSLFALAAGASVLDDAPPIRQRVLETLTIAAATVSLIGLLQHVGRLPLAIPIISVPGSTFGNRNLAAEVIALALPFGLAAAAGAERRDGRIAMFVALLLELVYLAVTRARGAWAGAACGLVVTLWLSRATWSRRSAGIALGTVLVAVAAAVVPGHFNPRDAGDAKRYSGLVEVLEGGLDARSTALKTRLGLWRRTLTMIGERPLLGVGPGNWPRIFPRLAEPRASADGVLSPSLAPRQAHEDYLERAAETGIPGLLALAFLGAAIVLAVRARLKSRPEEVPVTAAAAGSWAALSVLCLASFPFEMPGTLALSGIALGLLARDTVPGVRAKGAAAVGCLQIAAGLALLAVVLVRSERSLRGSYWLGVAARVARRDRGPEGAAEALESLQSSLEAAPNDFRAQLITAQTYARLGRSEESTRAAQAALALEPYSPNAYVALAVGALDGGDPAAAEKYATAALYLLHDEPYALHARIIAFERLHDEAAAAADRARLSELAEDKRNGETAREAQSLLAIP
jgi:O-antigen ligase